MIWVLTFLTINMENRNPHHQGPYLRPGNCREERGGGGGGSTKQEGGGASLVLSLRKGKFWCSLTQKLEVLAILNVLKEGGVNSFGPTIFPFCTPHYP